MKKVCLFSIVVAAFITNGAYADCTVSGTKYYACKPGYYLSSGNCVRCPNSGTTVDNNTGGITSCYIPSGTTGSDGTGSFKYTSNCYYSN